MADQRLNIIFSGDGTILSKTINELEQDLKGFEQELKKTNNTDAFKGISGKIAETTQRLTQLKGATQSFSNGMKSVASGSQSATFALTNLGRVVQDAPFGFLGIANNLNPLLESFQRLKAESGSTGKALSALGTSLAGAGGLGFALSIASSLLIVFGDALFKNKEKAEEDKTAIDRLAASMAQLKTNVDQYVSSVEFANKLGAINVQIRGQGNLQDLREQSVANLQLIQDISENAKKANDLVTQANARVVTVENDGSSKEAIANAKQAAAEGLTALRDIQAKENKARDDQRIIFRQIALQKIKDQKELNDKQKDLDEKFIEETIARARQFTKEFGNAFILPDLSDSFFKTKAELFKASKDLLDDVSKDLRKRSSLKELKIKLPVIIEASQVNETLSFTKDLEKLNKVIQSLGGEVQLNADDALETIKKLTVDREANIIINEKGLITSITRAVDGAIKVVQTKEIRIPVVTDADIKIAESLAKEVEISKDIIDGFFKSIEKEIEIPITIIPDLTLAKGNLDKIEEKLNLRKGFSVFGDFGLKEFNKIDFTNINAGIAEGTAKLREMMDVANTLNQAIGQGLVNAFDAAFDAVLEGKSVFKALGEAVKQLVVGTIKAVAQMLILKAVTSILFPGSSGIPLPLGGRGGVASPSFGGGVGGLRMAVEFTGQLTGRGSDLYGTVQQGQAQIGRVR